MGRRGDRERGSNLGPPPVVNKRFADLADEEREKNRDRESRKGPPPVANSRFAAAAELAAKEREERGPPPIANSRFAAAAEADRSASSYRDELPRGPPPIANSRFAAAAAMAEEERERDGRDRGGGFGRGERGPPPIANSRFAAAVTADEDYVEPEGRGFGGDSRGGGDRDRYDSRGGGGPRGGGERFDRRGGGGDYGGPRGGYPDRYDDRRGYEEEPPPAAEPTPEPAKNSVADLLKPKARPMEENILKVPSKQQEDNMLKIPMKKEHAENMLVPPKKETKAPATVPTPPEETPVVAAPAAATIDDTSVIDEFCSGQRLGDELKSWLGDQVIPNVQSLLYTFLERTQKNNPDVKCAWANTEQYGGALVSLVEDDLLKQVDVLFAIQKYCHSLGMPKLDGEYVIQAMFRNMYQFDLASDEAFEMWKEDEADENSDGKVTAVVQTVDWFNWLEQDEDEEDDEDE